jgi:hypothetical protein
LYNRNFQNILTGPKMKYLSRSRHRGLLRRPAMSAENAALAMNEIIRRSQTSKRVTQQTSQNVTRQTSQSETQQTSERVTQQTSSQSVTQQTSHQTISTKNAINRDRRFKRLKKWRLKKALSQVPFLSSEQVQSTPRNYHLEF